MKWKFALALSVLVTGVAAAHLGCANDTCDNADDQIQNCASAASTSAASSSGNAVSYNCDGVRLCQSNCINRATCEEITGNLPSYAACITACDGQP
jgi:hypothetical protein